jgi:hypothetical protein
MATKATVPADIIHKFEFNVTKAVRGIYNHREDRPEMPTKLELPSPLDEGFWTIKHSSEGRTIKVSLSWTGINRGALKGLIVTQSLKMDDRYFSNSPGLQDHVQTISSSTGCLQSRGEINLAMEDPIPVEHIFYSKPRDMEFEYTISFTRRPHDAGDMSEDSAPAKSAKLYFSEFSLPCFGRFNCLTADHTDTIDRKHSNDVRFVFPSDQGEELEIWANTRTLVDASPYFKALLTSEFAEGQLRNKSEHDAARDNVGKGVDDLEDDFDDSDDEMDLEIIGNPQVDSPAAIPCACTYREVVVRSTAFTTYKAVLGYLHSSFISFAPLSSSLSSDRDTSSDMMHTDDNTDSTRLPSASPKSVYRLAHLLELPKLVQLALNSIESQSIPSNVALELFGNLAGVYDDLRKVELDYFVANYAAVKATKTMDVVKQRAADGELTYYLATSMEVMERFS